MDSFQTSDDFSITQRILEAVSEETATPVLDLPPLYHAIDPDALEAVLRRPDSDIAPAQRRVQFSYAGYRITVDGSGEVSLSLEASVE